MNGLSQSSQNESDDNEMDTIENSSICGEREVSDADDSVEEKTFDCPVCDRQFFRNSNLQRHLKGHYRNKSEEDSREDSRNDVETVPSPQVGGKTNNDVDDEEMLQSPQGSDEVDGIAVEKQTDTSEMMKIDIPLSDLVESDGISLQDEGDYDDYDDKEGPNGLSYDLIFNQGEIPSDRSKWCYICDRYFTTDDEFEEHEKVHEGSDPNKPFKCEFCDKSFVNKWGVRKHFLYIHQQVKRYWCKDCGKGFVERFRLTEHMVMHSSDRPFKCDLCDRAFGLKKYLKAHYAVHMQEKDLPYGCDLCGKRYKCSTSLRDHVRSHTGELPFACKICGKKFRNQPNCDRHLKTHTPIEHRREHKCQLCDKSYKDAFYLKMHMFVHTGINDKWFECDVCAKKFPINSDLKKHMRIHTGEKPFKCHVCDKGFKQAGHLQSHMLTHSDDKPFVCEICDKGFKHTNSFKEHMKRHLGDKPYKCHVCGKAFISNPKLQRHVKGHEKDRHHPCTGCDKTFTRVKDLAQHLKNDHQLGCKPFACDLCGKKFTTPYNLRVHVKAHTDGKSYKCAACSKSYSTNSELRKHQRRKHGRALEPSNRGKRSHYLTAAYDIAAVSKLSNTESKFSKLNDGSVLENGKSDDSEMCIKQEPYDPEFDGPNDSEQCSSQTADHEIKEEVLDENPEPQPVQMFFNIKQEVTEPE